MQTISPRKGLVIIMGLAFLLFFSFIGIAIVGIIGTVMCTAGYFIIRKSGQHEGLRTLSVVGLIVSLIMLLGPALALLPIGASLTAVPEGYVETEVKIDEESYGYESFTAAGRKYLLTEMYVAEARDTQVPVLCYQPSGALSRYLYTTYYSVENEGGFDLVTDGWAIYCPEEQKDSLHEYYARGENVRWRLDETEITDELGTEIVALGESQNIEKFEYSDEDEYIWIECVSNDGRLLVSTHNLVVHEGRFYYEVTMESAGSLFTEYQDKCVGVALSEELTEKITAARDN